MCKLPDFGALVGTWVIAANAGWLRHPRIAAGREGLVARPCRLAGPICDRFSAGDLLCATPLFHRNACDRFTEVPRNPLIRVFPRRMKKRSCGDYFGGPKMRFRFLVCRKPTSR